MFKLLYIQTLLYNFINLLITIEVSHFLASLLPGIVVILEMMKQHVFDI